MGNDNISDAILFRAIGGVGDDPDISFHVAENRNYAIYACSRSSIRTA